jgi:photosystem II stability/assembly factor-like uncharacterized protein
MFFLLLFPINLFSQSQYRLKDSDTLKSSVLSGLKLRSIGPAMMSGRVSGFAVHPTSKSLFYVAVASGGVWKTTNGGMTWNPVFDGEGSFSVGCVALNPSNPFEVWVGAGEANSQRSVAFGDGVYKSDDAGKSWKNMGLKKSEHIAAIVFDPHDTNVMYVAAQGPLWSAGGERGLFKSTDAGKSWNNILNINENTGVTEVLLDPRNPDVVYVAAYQRRRHRWTMINGGPESSIQKSTDGGQTWKKVKSGLPGVDMGRIGLALSPVNPDVLYATVEAEGDAGGVFRSTDRGETWEKRNPFVDTQMYYGKIYCDPVDVDRIYISATSMQVSDDGGKTLSRLPIRNIHGDVHPIWVDPNNARHYLLGTDGGVHESWDRAESWQFKANLPTVQFYRVEVDNSKPFYYVYGGTQDNFSVGGPSRTKSSSGIVNSDWFITQGGDGFVSRIDSTNPNIVYAEYQYGGLARFDRATGEGVDIQPIADKDEESLRWNWDAPLIISPHNPARLYFGAQKLFRSDDRGNTWVVVSGDLSRQLDRNKLQVMGKLWGPDAVNKHGNTAVFGYLSFLSESPKQEGLIYAGTDDGLIQVTEDGGKNWRKVDKFPGVPESQGVGAYVSSVHASLFDANVVYASFDNHQMGDFKPYVLKSNDRGKTWSSIASNLPERGMVHCIAQDGADANLLFVGTEFGLFCTIDGGKKWTQLKSGLPIIAVRDIAVQREENDLALATFGRGFYVLDDYSPLRSLSSEMLAKEAAMFPVQDAQMYLQYSPIGSGKGEQGDSYFTAENPAYGATFTAFLKESIKTKKQSRKDAEKKEGFKYATADELKAEADEEAPSIFFSIADESGTAVRKISGKNESGLQRVNWDLKIPSADAIRGGSAEAGNNTSWLAMPGKYSVTMSKRVDGIETVIAGPMEFKCVPLGSPTLPSDRSALAAFQKKAMRLQKAANGFSQVMSETRTRIDALKAAILQTPAASLKLHEQLRDAEKKLIAIRRKFSGDEVRSRYNENPPPSIMNRVNAMTENLYSTTVEPTGTQRKAYDIAADEFTLEYEKLKRLTQADLSAIEQQLSAQGAPWTPGRWPEWSKEK